MSKLNNQSFNLMKALEENEQVEIKKRIVVDSYHGKLVESKELKESDYYYNDDFNERTKYLIQRISDIKTFIKLLIQEFGEYEYEDEEDKESDYNYEEGGHVIRVGGTTFYTNKAMDDIWSYDDDPYYTMEQLLDNENIAEFLLGEGLISNEDEFDESVNLTEERLGNNTFTDKDEAEYYRNKELYHQSGLERHKEAMDKAKEACKNKGIEVDETEGVYESCNKDLKEERVHRNPESDPNAEDKFVKKELNESKKSGYVIFVKDDSNGYSYQGIGGRSRVRLDMIDDLDIYDTVEQAQKEVNTYKNPKKIKIMKFDGKNATELNESCNKEELKEDEDTSKEERLASLKTQLEVDGDQLADDEKEAIQNEISQLENELNEEGAIDANSEVVTEECDKPLKEEYSEKLGGDPEDFVSDCQSILEILNGIDTESFGTHLAQQMIEEWIETAESQIKMAKSKYNLEEDEDIDSDEEESNEESEETLEDAINRAHEEEISAIETYDAVLGKTDESTDAKLIEMINEIKADEEDHKLLLQHYIETGEALSDDELEALKNSEESTEEVPVEEPIEESESKVAEEKVTNLKEVKSQGNIFMLQDDSKFFVGENYVEAEGLLENAEIYENKEEADKDYLSRCEITKDGEPANIE